MDRLRPSDLAPAEERDRVDLLNPDFETRTLRRGRATNERYYQLNRPSRWLRMLRRARAPPSSEFSIFLLVSTDHRAGPVVRPVMAESMHKKELKHGP